MTRKELVQEINAEANWAEKAYNWALEAASEGRCGDAWKHADTTNCAATCAMNAQEKLWALAEEDMTDEEFEAVEKAEVAQWMAWKAKRAAKEAVQVLSERMAQ